MTDRWLDIEQEQGEELVVFDPETARRHSGYGKPGAFMSRRPFCVTGLQVIQDPLPPGAESFYDGQLYVIRGCFHIVVVSIGEILDTKRRGLGEWWRVSVFNPPRQNLSFTSVPINRPFKLRFRWKHGTLANAETGQGPCDWNKQDGS